MILIIIAYILTGLITTFLTAIALGMAAAPGTVGGYVGLIQRCGSTPVGMALICLAMVALWPLHVILTVIVR